MILSKHYIEAAFNSGAWSITSNGNKITPKHIGTNSIDVSLSSHLLLANRSFRNYEDQDSGSNDPLGTSNLDPLNYDPNTSTELFRPYEIPDDSKYLLVPNYLILGSTQEAIDCSTPLIINGKEVSFIPMYEGRSTIGRLGLVTHLTAGFGDYGFDGHWTLEIINHAPWNTYLTPGMRIGQVYFISADEDISQQDKYKGYSQNKSLPVGPLLGSNRF